MIDLKLRVPPHLAHKLLQASFPPAPEPVPPPPPSAAPPVQIGEFLARHAGLGACACTLLLLLAASEERLGEVACAHLGLAPLTVTALVCFNLRHRRARGWTVGLAVLGCLLGNGGAVGMCMAGARVLEARVLLSGGMATGGLQLLLLMPKHNVGAVMVCTACAVVVCVLAAAAPLVTLGTAARCYQSAVAPLLWLFVHAEGGDAAG